ncbi:ribonuclease 3-like protein 2 [Prunus yedoensis var. nudiflora]|uniref:Ribonuclease 3-like protein 2 n=1 Tax=Prunus yedoensis var. nudiflora TaxID=2094558 RepID=A0A314UPD6_PRUYE|nr:ribonuclease 3-like protein 2 [Prunus yedoensis var. nudiflora]
MKVFTTPTSLDRVLEPSPDMKESVMAVEKIVGYNFKNKKLLEEALTHPSFTGSASYQRLEVLGDSALNHAVTNYFFCMADYQKFTQGQITKLRSANAGNLNLARVAVRHGLYRYLRRNAPDLDDQVREFTEAVINGEEMVESEEAKVLADIVESVAAAIYIELNFDLDKLWMKFKPLLDPIFTLENLHDHPKTELNEFCQKNGKDYEIKLRPRHETRNVSIADVYVDGEFIASGSSNKKKGARVYAAKEAVNKLCQSVVVDDGSFQEEVA